MAILKKKNKANELPSLDQLVSKKLLIFVTIVGHGAGTPVTKLFERYGASAQFVQRGEGTATKEINNILGIEDNEKDIVFSFVTEDVVPEIKKELEAFFVINKRNRGIGMTLPLSSIIGIRVYQFLANTVEDK